MAMRASQLGKHLARGVKQACLGAQGESISKLRMLSWLDP